MTAGSPRSKTYSTIASCVWVTLCLPVLSYFIIKRTGYGMKPEEINANIESEPSNNINEDFEETNAIIESEPSDNVIEEFGEESIDNEIYYY